MSQLGRFYRKAFVQQQQHIRFASTQYVAGRKGYAPGFEAPEGTRENIKLEKPRRDLGHSLPSHLEGKKAVLNNSTSPKKLYRQELRVTRHTYARELLEKHGQRQLKSAEKLAATEQKAKADKEALLEAKKEQQAHEQQVAEMLSLSTEKSSQISTEDRNAQRAANRLQLEQAQRDTRRKQLLKLYAYTDSFVTLDNLDAKVDAVMSSEGRSFHEGFNELMHNTSTVQAEIEHRKSQLKEVMGL